MSQSNDTVLGMYTNPQKIQAQILTDMQNRITGGRPIVSANNVCSFLIESFSQMSADIVQGTVNEFASLYPRRAMTAEHLYKHMSNYDYVGLFSTPSRVFIQLVLRKDQIIRDSVDVNDNYKKIVIPKDSVFLIDQYRFSLYYPIEIRINKRTNTLLVSYDTSESNPLFTLTQNTLEHKTNTIRGLEMVSIQIPLYQFKRDVYIDTVVPSSSFSKVYDYTDKFYAARVFTNNDPNDQNAWVEIDQTLSDNVYDPEIVTAKLTVDQQQNQLRVTIPQVYLTNKLLGNKLRVELLTTDGAVDADISNITQESISATFTLSGNPETDKYIQFLNRPEVFIVSPTSKKILGGSDGLAFDELRQRVIHNSFHGNVLLTPTDLDNYFNDIGFKITKYQDGITRRIYLAHKEITDLNGVISASANLASVFTLGILSDAENYSTIQNNNDESFTILPTTVYKYNGLNCVPLDDTDRIALGNMTREDLVAELNSNIYTINPFHVRVDTGRRYPMAYAYDFTNPTINSIEFLGENINITTQLSVFNATITHPIEGVGGFTIELEVVRSKDIKDVPTENLKIVAVVKNIAGIPVFQEAVYDRTEAGLDIYKIHLTTDYDLTQDHRLNITSLKTSNDSFGHIIDLTTDIKLVFMIDKSIINYDSNLPISVGHDIESSYPDHVALAEQSLNTTFGRWISENFSRVDLLASDETYQTYEVDVVATYPTDDFVRDELGNLVYDGGQDPVYIPVANMAGDILYTESSVLITAENASDYHGTYIVGTRTVLSAGNQDDYIDAEEPTKLVIIDPEYEERVDVDLTLGNVADYYDAEIYLSETVIDADNEADYYDTVQTIRIPTLLHGAGDFVLDEFGNRIKVANRDLQYHIDMTHVNKRLIHSENPAHEDYLSSIAEQLRTYYEIVQESRSQLIEETELYFRPLRSLGTSNFKISSVSSRVLDLELDMKFKLYVLPHVVEDARLLDSIRDTVIRIIDERVKDDVISITEISEDIRASMPQMVSHVDVLGINGETTLQTLLPVEDDVVPSLKQRLYIADDGTIDIERAVTIDYVTIDPPNQTQSA